MPGIRRATIEDADVILKLSKGLFLELGHRLALGDRESLSFCRAMLTNANYVVFVSNGLHACANGVIALREAFSVYDEGKFGVIREFYVIPEVRSNGIGKALLQKAKEFGRRNGWRSIEVLPPDRSNWPRTYNFYLREGFEEAGAKLQLENLDQR